MDTVIVPRSRSARLAPRKIPSRASALLLVLMMLAQPAGSQQVIEAPDEKLRVLVDKVLMAANDWVMTEAHVEEIAAAGFNVVTPRRGNDDISEVRRIASLAARRLAGPGRRTGRQRQASGLG